uniref:WD repeat-containing protein 44 n=1 Tax=Aceria tosichella TaxID=561515 RepID=A0A6G1S8N3_9ACAR
MVMTTPTTTTNVEYSTYSKFYQLNRHKSEQAEFENVKLYKEICDTKEAIWCMKWSSCGQLLAAAGGDHMIRIYCCPKAWKYFSQLRIKASGQHISPTPSKERDNQSSTNLGGSGKSSSNNEQQSSSNTDGITRSKSTNETNQQSNSNIKRSTSFLSNEDTSISEDPLLLFSIYQGHTADILDVAWSRNHFLLSSSMDKTVRLWHITRLECLCTFFHADFVSTAQFHPHDDRYFVSGSLDGKLRLWSIPDKKVTMWNEVMSLPLKDNEQPTHGLITASAFVQNGKFAVIGTYDGRIIFYSTEQLKFFTQLHVGKHHEKIKITGIESVDDTKILVTTNDSRIRLYDLRDLSLVCKYKGCTNISSQIRATVSPDNKYIVCGSENSSFYIWPMYETSSQRKDRNYAWECLRLTSGTDVNIITATNFAPIPQLIVPQSKYVIVVADLHGTIRILNK